VQDIQYAWKDQKWIQIFNQEDLGGQGIVGRIILRSYETRSSQKKYFALI
jgi:hypothetical protein